MKYMKALNTITNFMYVLSDDSGQVMMPAELAYAFENGHHGPVK